MGQSLSVRCPAAFAAPVLPVGMIPRFCSAAASSACSPTCAPPDGYDWAALKEAFVPVIPPYQRAHLPQPVTDWAHFASEAHLCGQPVKETIDVEAPEQQVAGIHRAMTTRTEVSVRDHIRHPLAAVRTAGR